MRGRFLLLVSTLLLSTIGIVFAREWTSSGGKFKIEAEFVAVKNGKAILEKPDGTFVSVPLDKLSPDDLAYIEEQTGAPVEVPQAGNNNGAKANVRIAKLKGEKPDDPPGEARNLGKMGWGVESLAFSPDGRFLAVGKMDDALWIFDVSEGNKAAEFNDLKLLGDVLVCRFMPDGKRLLTGGKTGLIQFWSVSSNGATKQLGDQFAGHTDGILCLDVTPDGQFAVSGGEDKRLRYWRTEKPRELGSYALEDDVKACFINASGTTAMATDGEKLFTVDLESERVTMSNLPEGSTVAYYARFSPDGKKLGVADGYKIHFYDTATGRLSDTLKENEIQRGGVFTPDGKRFVTGGRAGVNVFDLTRMSRIGVVATAGTLPVEVIGMSPDNWHVAAISGSAGQELQVLRIPLE